MKHLRRFYPRESYFARRLQWGHRLGLFEIVIPGVSVKGRLGQADKWTNECSYYLLRRGANHVSQEWTRSYVGVVFILDYLNILYLFTPRKNLPRISTFCGKEYRSVLENNARMIAAILNNLSFVSACNFVRDKYRNKNIKPIILYI